MLKLHEEMRACRRCLEAGFNITPGAVFSGQPGARVMLIGQAPGLTEVEAKRPFNAGSGRRLFQWLDAAGWDEAGFRSTHYMTAVTKCYPGKSNNGKGDRVPGKAEQALCRPFLERELTLVNPQLIILVGGLAIKLIFPTSTLLKDIIGTAVFFPPESWINPDNLNLRHGKWIRPGDNLIPIKDYAPHGCWVIPLPHPSGASLWPNKPENKALIARAIKILNDIRETNGLT